MTSYGYLGAALLAAATFVGFGGLKRNAFKRLARPTSGPAISPWWLVAVPALGVASALLLTKGLLTWFLAALVAGAGIWKVTKQHFAVARQLRQSREVRRAVESLAVLLDAGRIPSQAVLEAADEHACLLRAATAVRLGADSAAAMDTSATGDGYPGMATVAAAWKISEDSGAPVAGVMTRIAAGLREDQRIVEVVAVELASARLSGRMMALLPFATLGLGILVGANPIAFLVHEGLGQWLFLGGVVLAALGVVWTERIASAPMLQGVVVSSRT